MAIELRDQLSSVVGSSAGMVRYQIGKAAGKADARHYFEKTEVQDTILKLAMGLTSFALNGYANVTILPETSPSPDNNFLPVYDQDNSYEADAHIKARILADGPVDFFTVGYSAGWCTESFSTTGSKGSYLQSHGRSAVQNSNRSSRRIRERVKEIKAIYQV
jgi:hypothetical protein